MAIEFKFKPLGYYIDTDVNRFSSSLIELINNAAQLKLIEISNLKFTSKIAFNVNKVDMASIINNGIPIFDWLVFLNLSDEEKAKIVWTVDSSRRLYDETQISYSILFIYFMIMTRNKPYPERNEQFPLFLGKFMKVTMTLDDIKDCLSNNNLNMFTHSWVRNVKLAKLIDPIKNRLRQGIAGMRIFTLIANNEPDKDIDAHLQNLVDRIRILVHNGPYWEMHTLFQTAKLASMSVNANLNNLLLELYSNEKLETLVKSRMLFKLPQYNPRALSYKVWSSEFFNEYKTKMIFDEEVNK